VLEELRSQLPDRQIELLSVGGAPAVRVDGIRYRTFGWSVAAEREALASMDIGVMPLPNTPWTRGKCAYKALQYMAAGVPVVSDPVGVTAEIVGGGPGSVAADPRDWVDAIVAFATDAEARSRAGAAGRARVEADFSTRRWTPTVAAILRGEGP
jgi:glycosyltransferase involved in cell wall biosynthesis